MSEAHAFGNFVNGAHAFHTGLVAGILRGHPGVAVSPETDAAGDYTPDIHLAIGKEEYTVTLHVVGVHDDQGQTR